MISFFNPSRAAHQGCRCQSGRIMDWSATRILSDAFSLLKKGFGSSRINCFWSAVMPIILVQCAPPFSQKRKKVTYPPLWMNFRTCLRLAFLIRWACHGRLCSCANRLNAVVNPQGAVAPPNLGIQPGILPKGGILAMTSVFETFFAFRPFNSISTFRTMAAHVGPQSLLDFLLIEKPCER